MLDDYISGLRVPEAVKGGRVRGFIATGGNIEALAKLGLDVHNRGLVTVAMELRDEGMEVIYLGNCLPDEIMATAVQEQVDVIGVSSKG